ncbi:MAG: CCA tRNA nucleotidyltransferase [Alphaproteobacteria bacterium]
MSERLDPAKHPWMRAPETLAVVAALTAGGGEARFVGGAVRNALLGQPVTDIDIATPLTPQEVAARLERVGLLMVPTGIEHGTVTAVANGKPFEVTTLRRDVSTDGRRAVVTYTNDWAEDAARRDFTINALYAAPDGALFDPAGGVGDLKAGRVRFVGEPRTRIREDYLRILRLFRFYAWYGKGEIDGAALEAAVAEKAGLKRLSGERIRNELLKLLAAPDPLHTIHAMEQRGVLAEVLPWRLLPERLAYLVRIDSENGFAPDALLRLGALMPSDLKAIEKLGDALKLSNAERDRLNAVAANRLNPGLREHEARAALYRLGKRAFKDAVMLQWAESGADGKWKSLIRLTDTWRRPQFPIDGRDAMAAGLKEGPAVGKVLGELEQWWIENDFRPHRAALLARLKALAQR